MLQTAFRIFNQCQNKAFIIIRCWGCNWWVSILMPCLAAFRWKILAFKKNFEFSIHVEAVKSNKGRIYGTLANNDSKNDLELIEWKNKHREFFKPFWNWKWEFMNFSICLSKYLVLFLDCGIFYELISIKSIWPY